MAIFCDLKNMSIKFEKKTYLQKSINQPNKWPFPKRESCKRGKYFPSYQALAALGQEVVGLQGEEHRLRRQLAAVDSNNCQMMEIVGQFEETIEQLLKEKAREKQSLRAGIEKKMEEKEQVRSEVSDVERANKDLSKKYSRTKEVIQAHMASEAGLKVEVEEMSSRHKRGGERYQLLKTHAETRLEEANNRLGEVSTDSVGWRGVEYVLSLR